MVHSPRLDAASAIRAGPHIALVKSPPPDAEGRIGISRVLRLHWLFFGRRVAGTFFRIQHLFRGVYIESGFTVQGGRNITLHRGVVIQRRSVFTTAPGARLVVGRGTRVGSDAVISVAHEVILGENVLIAARCFIADYGHRFSNQDVPVMHQGAETPRAVRIDDGAWLGINVCILPGVHLGRNCVVGANSVVTQSVPAGAIVAGVPARVVRTTGGETEDPSR